MLGHGQGRNIQDSDIVNARHAVLELHTEIDVGILASIDSFLCHSIAKSLKLRLLGFEKLLI